MQTFLPVPDFEESARALDRLRLGKQRVEGTQIDNALEDPSNGWHRHPAVQMRCAYRDALRAYTNAMITEWVRRGYRNTIPLFDVPDQYCLPPWFGNEAFHRSHRSNLLRKAPGHYRQFWPDERDDLPYVWPSKLTRETVVFY